MRKFDWKLPYFPRDIVLGVLSAVHSWEDAERFSLELSHVRIWLNFLYGE